MALKIVLISLTLVIALIGVLASKDLSRKIIVTVVLLYIVLAIISLIHEWRTEDIEREYRAQDATSGKLEDVTTSRILQGKRAVNVEIGSSRSIFAHTMNPDQNSFRLFQGIKSWQWFPIWFTIDRDRIRVSADIRDCKGDVIAKMVENEWKINEGNTLDRNYTDDALEIINNKDEVVLQVVLLSDRVQISKIMLLGHEGPLKWQRDSEGLRIRMPSQKPCEHAVAFKIELDN